jgi:hypothetical protein
MTDDIKIHCTCSINVFSGAHNIKEEEKKYSSKDKKRRRRRRREKYSSCK